MAQFAINSNATGDIWYAQIINSGLTEYQFTTFEAVHELATAMSAGENAVLDVLRAGNTFLGEVPSEEVLYRECFGVTRQAIFQGRIFDEVEDPWETLEDIIERVGVELVELLGLAVQKVSEAGKSIPRGVQVKTKQPSGLVWKQISAEPADLAQKWTNFSKQTFTVTYEFYNPFANLISVPTTPLKPGYSTSLSWYQAFSSAWTQECDGWILFTGADGVSFGINIHVPQQIFGVGTPPYYQVWQGTGKPVWTASEQRSAEGYTFKGLSCGEVQVFPTASHTYLLLDITIPHT